MIMLLNILIVLSLVIVVLALVFGGLNMRKPGETARVKANRLMRVRIGAQLAAVIFLVLLVFVRNKLRGG